MHVLATGKVKKVLAKVEMEDRIYGPVLAATGVLYVKTMKNLYAISGK